MLESSDGWSLIGDARLKVVEAEKKSCWQVQTPELMDNPVAAATELASNPAAAQSFLDNPLFRTMAEGLFHRPIHCAIYLLSLRAAPRGETDCSFCVWALQV
jgi:hypothetical protein